MADYDLNSIANRCAEADAHHFGFECGSNQNI